MAGFVDLNEPAFVPTADSTASTPKYEPRYPIVSPYGKYSFNGTFNTTSEPAPGAGAVEGFYCKDYADAIHKDANNQAIRLLPMRAKWLYILRDGTIAPLIGNKIQGATAANPPVARTAFWVDDESCKLNINTASEGTYWDTPVVNSIQESGSKDGNEDPALPPPASLNLAMSQPVRAEYQRFPGHPATTCLSPAIRWLFNDPSRGYSYPPVANSPDTEFKEAVYRLAPRIKETFGTRTNADSSRGGTYRGRTPATLTRKPDSDRLYASVDEYFFRPDRTGRDYAETASTHADPISGSLSKDVPILGFTPDNLEKLRFFLTASSRAPDLNVFGKPRVTIWPINKNIGQRTAYDDLFEYCSNVGGMAFNFTRSDPNSATYDFEQIPRNKAIYKYLQDVTSAKIPFLGRSFVDKYGDANVDQTLTEIFDYIRSTNLVDTEAGSHGTFAQSRSDGLGRTGSSFDTYPIAFTRFFWKDTEGSDTNFGSGQVIPIRIDKSNNASGKDTQGFGRFVTPDEVGILFCRIPPAAATDLVKIRAVLLVSMFSPGCGYPGLAERYTMNVQFAPGVTGWRVLDAANPNNPIPMNFPNTSCNIVDVDAYSGAIGRMFMPSRGFANQFLSWTGAGGWQTQPKRFEKPNILGSSADVNKYPFFSDEITLPKNTTKFGFTGGDMKIEIYSRHPGSPVKNDQDKVQSIAIYFPDVTGGVPVPTVNTTDPREFKDRLKRGSDRQNLTAGDLGAPDDVDPKKRGSGYRWIESGDVIRSMDLGGKIAQGDTRLVAINPDIAQSGNNRTYFDRRGGDAIYNGSQARVHGFRVGRGGSYTPNSDSAWDVNDGTLVFKGSAENRRNDRRAKIPAMVNDASVDGVKMLNGNWGDWDRGISKNVDGPFINRADEGNVNFEPGALGIPYYLGFSGATEVGPTYFSPNRLMPSPVMFGGLPSRGVTNTASSGDPAPWETLLFRPQAFANEHRGGSEAPADHYLLDLFHMPVVEPYAISEPLSTAGKVNLNYVIAPYGYVKPLGTPGGAAYIERKTGLHAVLKPVMMLLVRGDAPYYAHASPNGTAMSDDPTLTGEKFRFEIDRTATLKEIQNRIDTKGLFKTASEICEVPLYPAGAAGTPTAPNAVGWKSFWENYRLTGDNCRERPYALIYPRVTTKSNVFTVYLRAQSIRKNPTTAPDVFDEAKDQVTGEYRGSSTIERYIDPNDPALAGYDPSTGAGLDGNYRYRILNTKRFTP
jgi:uncharacterized protein (TIGR02600 family)